MTHRVRHIETHVAHGCNLACEGCTHFSNDGHAGRHTPATFLAEHEPWSRRLTPEWLLLLGGEPALNPQLPEIVRLARRLWPAPVKIILVSNGLLLHRHRDRLPAALRETDTRLDITVHHDGPEYLGRLAEVEEMVAGWGVRTHRRDGHGDWVRYYKGSGADVRPFDDRDPKRSWHACVSRWCMNLVGGKLYKCPMTAYLPMQAAKFELAHAGEWAPYLAYRPLSPDCTDAELAQFIIKTVEPCCGMCPARPERFVKPDPTRRKLS